MAKWFDDVFLASLFERIGVNNSKWLTVKQTSVCLNYMTLNVMNYQANAIGTMYAHNYYTYNWQGRRVMLNYSKKNGCGSIEFGMNAEEQTENTKRAEAERHQRELEHIKFVKAKPERLEQKIRKLNEELRILHESLERTQEFINSGDYDSGDIDYVEYLSEQIRITAKELNIYTH